MAPFSWVANTLLLWDFNMACLIFVWDLLCVSLSSFLCLCSVRYRIKKIKTRNGFLGLSRKNLIRLHTTLTSTPYNIVGINWNANCEANLNIWHHCVTLMPDLCPISVCSCGWMGENHCFKFQANTHLLWRRERKNLDLVYRERNIDNAAFLKYMFQVFWFDWEKKLWMSRK